MYVSAQCPLVFTSVTQARIASIVASSRRSRPGGELKLRSIVHLRTRREARARDVDARTLNSEALCPDHNKSTEMLRRHAMSTSVLAWSSEHYCSTSQACSSGTPGCVGAAWAFSEAREAHGAVSSNVVEALVNQRSYVHSPVQLVFVCGLLGRFSGH